MMSLCLFTCAVFKPFDFPNTLMFFLLHPPGISMFLVREPGLSTGPQRQSVRWCNTDLPVWA